MGSGSFQTQSWLEFGPSPENSARGPEGRSGCVGTGKGLPRLVVSSRGSGSILMKKLSELGGAQRTPVLQSGGGLCWFHASLGPRAPPLPTPLPISDLAALGPHTSSPTFFSHLRHRDGPPSLRAPSRGGASLLTPPETPQGEETPACPGGGDSNPPGRTRPLPGKRGAGPWVGLFPLCLRALKIKVSGGFWPRESARFPQGAERGAQRCPVCLRQLRSGEAVPAPDGQARSADRGTDGQHCSRPCPALCRGGPARVTPHPCSAGTLRDWLGTGRRAGQEQDRTYSVWKEGQSRGAPGRTPTPAPQCHGTWGTQAA
ncbi:uncharacterized protein LOC123831586 [Phyllostomus hastatus]|uniref:uncharacterized protein LOC123831586 n=1 Tax=Phyllostomus hastatus TaxID=9423 RepID=UPI001E681BA6|nr:uncharacterized protein LOC123831586 [Phyllostomus hastatus]XP_045714492.1 uncharacterized protein LOC123831586 [Phyllostomus hastatus]